MNILIVSQYFWPEHFQINPIAARLVRLGHRVDVLTGQPNYPQGRIYSGYSAWRCQREEHEGITVLRLPLAPRASGALRLAFNYLSFIGSGLLLGAWALRGRRHDAVFVYAPSPLLQALPAILLARLRRRPLVLWVQDLWPESLSATGYVRNRTVIGVIERVVRFIYRHTDLALVQSRAFEEPVRKLAPGTPLGYLPNSVDDSFDRNRLPPSSAAPDMPSGFIVLFAGNLGSAQAVDCILDAAEILRSHDGIHFQIVGDGSRRHWMQEQVEQRDLTNVTLPGRFPPEQMPAMMQRASALLVTLNADQIFEYTVPSKIQAYMACGKPIIAALNGEGARLVEEAGAGLAVPAMNAAALASAILRLHDMPAVQREEMGDAGHAYYNAHFREELIVDKLVAFLEQASAMKEGRR